MKKMATVGKRVNKDRPECFLLAFMAPIASGYNHATTGPTSIEYGTNHHRI